MFISYIAMPAHTLSTITILLADDDADDCLLFRDALGELDLDTKLSTVVNGEQLMEVLNRTEPLPNLLFLDLNMPRKNGFDCLLEIRESERLHRLPVIILSTSLEENMVKLLYANGADYYICKPNEFSQLVSVIRIALTITSLIDHPRPSLKEFLLLPESCTNETK
jgi:DNA-binding response OmpR family regulator